MIQLNQLIPLSSRLFDYSFQPPSTAALPTVPMPPYCSFSSSPTQLFPLPYPSLISPPQAPLLLCLCV
ncbi:hypothetical protein B484DRAFT_445021 [Ochromonadaceae sp. CCMP2298]|nr:hypothetical protein B484DRAFT_445021 [Ochromonadaceae sp. CCMP2298]